VPNRQGVLAEGAASSGYRDTVNSERIPGGVVHKLPGDLRTALIGNATALAAWKDHHAVGTQRVHLLGRGCQTREHQERRIRGPRRSWRRACAGRAAGPGASIASALAGNRPTRGSQKSQSSSSVLTALPITCERARTREEVVVLIRDLVAGLREALAA